MCQWCWCSPTRRTTSEHWWMYQIFMANKQRSTLRCGNVSSSSTGPHTINHPILHTDMNKIIRRMAPIFDAQSMMIMAYHQCHMVHQPMRYHHIMVQCRGRNKQQVYTHTKVVVIETHCLRVFGYIGVKL